MRITAGKVTAGKDLMTAVSEEVYTTFPNVPAARVDQLFHCFFPLMICRSTPVQKRMSQYTKSGEMVAKNLVQTKNQKQGSTVRIVIVVANWHCHCSHCIFTVFFRTIFSIQYWVLKKYHYISS